MRDQERLTDVEITVIASAQGQASLSIGAAHERSRIARTIVLRVSHELHTQLVFPEGEIIHIAHRHEMIELVSAPDVRQGHHPLLGKRHVQLELAELEVQPR